jgi:hypothetical protein
MNDKTASTLLTVTANYDEPGSWGRASIDWPAFPDKDEKLRHLVIQKKIVPYGAYVTVNGWLRIHPDYNEKVWEFILSNDVQGDPKTQFIGIDKGSADGDCTVRATRNDDGSITVDSVIYTKAQKETPMNDKIPEALAVLDNEIIVITNTKFMVDYGMNDARKAAYAEQLSSLRKARAAFAELIEAHKESVAELVRIRCAGLTVCSAVENSRGVVKHTNELLRELDKPWSVERSRKALAAVEELK